MTLLYSFLWNKYLNQSGNLRIQPELIEYLFLNTKQDELLFYSDRAYVIELLLLLKDPSTKPLHTVKLDEATYYVTVSEQKVAQDRIKQSVLFEHFFDIVSKTLHFKRSKDALDPPYSEVPENTQLHFSKEKTFGDIHIYRIVKDVK